MKKRGTKPVFEKGPQFLGGKKKKKKKKKKRGFSKRFHRHIIWLGSGRQSRIYEKRRLGIRGNPEDILYATTGQGEATSSRGEQRTLSWQKNVHVERRSEEW